MQENKQVALGGTQVQASGVNEVTTAHREVATIQGQIVMARRFPRNEEGSRERILRSCERPGLAFVAIYKYAKGNTNIEGASIRLAEEIARAWGNIDFGIHELEQLDGESVVEAYAWDLETNTRQTKRFTVPHTRYTKSGSYKLTDPREIYETVANSGARRLRACILGIIPSDIVDEATEACKATQQKHTQVDSKNVSAMVNAYKAVGVTVPMIEARIQRSISAIDAYYLSELRNIYSSIIDGMGGPEDYFDMTITAEVKAKALGDSKPKDKKKAVPKAPDAPKREPKVGEPEKKVDSSPVDEAELFSEGF